MEYPLDPKAEIFKWGPIPMKLILPFSTSFPGCFELFAKEYPGYQTPTGVILIRDSRCAWMHDSVAIREHGKKLFTDFMLDDKRRSDEWEKWQGALKELHAFGEHLDAIDRTALSDAEFLASWNDFKKMLDEFWVRSKIPEFGNFGGPDILQEQLGPLLPGDALSSVMEILTAPEEPSFYQREEIELAETNDLEAHRAKYFWIHYSYSALDETTLQDFEQRKKELQSDLREKLRVYFDDVRKRKTEIAARYRIPQDVVALAHAIVVGIVWQDERKMEIWKYLHTLDLICTEAARRFGIEKNDFMNLYASEMETVLTTRQVPSGIRDRQHSSGAVSDGVSPMIYLDADTAQNYWKMYMEASIGEEIKEFKGIPTSRGTGPVQGRVRIVHDPSADFAQGDILVTSMTSPEFVFLMKKAAAIVTDTGGLMSHAAIVSRELGVPCIVGTKVATQVLKDGDMIEVDAAKGTVRKL